MAVVAGGLAAVGALRHRYLRWGAEPAETQMPLPGDAILPLADLVATRAVTIRTPPDRVWPWLAQMGQGRGGLYSYDALENLVGCDIHSADRIVPEWQRIEVGDEVRLHPSAGLAVAEVAPGRALVLRGGAPVDAQPAPFDFTWAFVLHGREDGTTRLVVRERYAYRRPWVRLVVEPVGAASAVMSRRMLLGIKERAERPSVA